MSGEPSDSFETPTSSKNEHPNLKRKSCPARLQCKTARSDLGTPLRPNFTTNRRPHRLSESQKAQLRQRRLEFQTTNIDDAEKTEQTLIVNKDPTSFSRDELIELIKKLEIELVARNEHENKLKELENRIEIWKKGFNEAVTDFRSHIQAKQHTYLSKKSILQQLNISSDLVKYLDDSDD